MAGLQKRTLTEWLDDLCVRFIINLPQEELESVERICFQVEEAQWFYEDFIRPLDPSLPSMNLKKFCMVIFQHCPLLSEFSQYHFAAFSEFLAYKQRVPVRGAIMLNEAMTEVVLVKGWKKGARWSFPRGKINKDESDLDCAVREVYEETGYNIKLAGLADDPDRVHSIEVSMREQHMKLFVFRGVPTDTYFEPRTRKEISAIHWYKIAELPTVKQMRSHQQGEGDTQQQSGKFYMVAPFLGPLKQWIRAQKKKDKLGITSATIAAMPTDDEAIADQAVSDVEAVARRNAPEQGDDHFNNLVANLKTSIQPQEPGPAEQQQPQADSAAALKRLLSVGHGPIPQVAPTISLPTQAPPLAHNPLLDLLRGSSPAAPQHYGAQQPVTPMEQVIHTPQHPQTPPHHNHVRPPHAVQPGFQQEPPQFPILPSTNWQPQRPPQQPSYAQAGNQHPVPPPHQQRQEPPPMLPQRSEHTSQLLNLFRSNAREDSVHLKQPPSVGLMGPSPGLASAPSLQPSMVPQASRLPPPNLTSHTMSLLSAFKSPPQKAVAPVQQLQHQVSELSASDTSPTMPSRRAYPTAAQASHQPQQAPPAQQQQQNSLLDLFRSPSNGARRPTQPVELAAQPSPNPVFHHFPQQLSKPNLGLQTTALGQPSPSGLTSATVTGPLHSPNLEMLRQHQPPPVEMGENTPVVPPHVYRPALDEALPQWPKPHNASVQALSPASNAPEVTRQIAAPQPVSYQILQRPALLKNPQPGPTSSPSHAERRSSIPSDQKNALLSLLTGAQPPANQIHGLKPSPSGIMSPVSPLPGGNGKSLQSSPAGGDAKSRVSSITSLPGNVAGAGSSSGMGPGLGQAHAGGQHQHHHYQPPVSMIMTEYGLPAANVEKLMPQMPFSQQQQRPQAKQPQLKMLGQGVAGASGSPSSPVDKSALLGFLRDVAKG